jgi:hypothetical protein
MAGLWSDLVGVRKLLLLSFPKTPMPDGNWQTPHSTGGSGSYIYSFLQPRERHEKKRKKT